MVRTMHTVLVLHGYRVTLLGMANVTISIDEETLRRARIRALERGTSLNALVREYLERLVGDDLGTTAARRFIARAERARSSSGEGGRTWRREDAYDV